MEYPFGMGCGNRCLGASLWTRRRQTLLGSADRELAQATSRALAALLALPAAASLRAEDDVRAVFLAPRRGARTPPAAPATTGGSPPAR